MTATYRMPLLLALLLSMPVFAAAADTATPKTGVTPPSPSQAPAKKPPPPAVGFRYAILSLQNIVIYADGPISLIQDGKRQDHPRGTLLMLEESLVKNLGPTSEGQIAAGIASTGIEKQFAENAAILMKRQPRMRSAGCTKDTMSFAMLGMMGSIVGASGGMKISSPAGIAVTIPACATK
jgi:hypothetical protein